MSGTPRRRDLSRALPLLLVVALTGLLSFRTVVRPRTEPDRDVVLILVDTLRADRVGFAAGGGKSTTPALDRLAQRGSWFADAWSCAPWTPPSTMSLLTSREPPAHGLDLPGERWAEGAPAPAADATPLAEVLRAHGYRTLAVTAGGGVGAALGFSRGFDRYYEPRPTPPEDVANGVDRAIDWLAEPYDGPTFLFFHTYEVHSPNTHGHPESSGTPAELAVAAYDRDLAFADRELGRLFAALEQGDRTRRAIVIVTSDHGENLYDRILGDRPVDHGHHLHAELLRIPLFVVAPGLVPVRRGLPGPVQSIDVMPTVLSLLGISGEGLAMQGRDLRPVLQGIRPPDLERELYFWAPLQGPTWRAVRTKSSTLIEAPPVPGPNWWNRIELPARSLYDRRTDPGERIDLAAAEPDRALALARRLDRRAAGDAALLASSPRHAVAPAGPDDPSAALRALGYLDRRPTTVPDAPPGVSHEPE